MRKKSAGCGNNINDNVIMVVMVDVSQALRREDIANCDKNMTNAKLNCVNITFVLNYIITKYQKSTKTDNVRLSNYAVTHYIM